MVSDRFRVFEGNLLKAGILLFFLFMFGNMLILDVLFIQGFSSKKTPPNLEKEKIAPDGLGLESEKQAICPTSCIERIDEAVSAANLKENEREDVPVSSSQVKESLITSGAGTNNSTDYENIPTTQVYIDPSKYGAIKSIKFEVSLAVPTANQFVYVRLFNVTDGNPVWNSEMYMSGGPTAYLVSGPITLAPGSKLYVVQIKSQLKATTNLNQARLRIETY